MPELPEVETVVRDLRELLVGKQFAAIRCVRRDLRKPWNVDWNAILVGETVESIRRRGKWIVMHLTSSQELLFHLGMTGQLTVTKADAAILDHTHLLFDLANTDQQLRFRDIRRFGSATLFANAEAVEVFIGKTLGSEPFELTDKAFHTSVTATKRNLKAILLDQHVVAGVGNIYADEALFRAKLHPGKLGCDLTLAECKRLRKAIVEVLNHAIENRGSSIRNYVGGSGLKGGFQNEFRVYGRTGEPCPRCETPIEMVRLAQRSSHYCPQCQRAE